MSDRLIDRVLDPQFVNGLGDLGGLADFGLDEDVCADGHGVRLLGLVLVLGSEAPAS